MVPAAEHGAHADVETVHTPTLCALKLVTFGKEAAHRQVLFHRHREKTRRPSGTIATASRMIFASASR